jgi:hypothetical protein
LSKALLAIAPALLAAACGSSPLSPTAKRPAWDQVDPPTGTALHRGTTVTVSARINDRALAGAGLILSMVIRTPQGVVSEDYYPRQEWPQPPVDGARRVPATVASRLIEPLDAPKDLPAFPPGSRLLELRASLNVPEQDTAGPRLIAAYPIVD